MKKTVLFVLLEKYADWEAAHLAAALTQLGKGEYEVKTVSLTKEPVESIGGFHVQPDYDLASAPRDYEALILIGGTGWRQESAQPVKELVAGCVKSAKVLGGICDASAFLGTLGVLNNVNHTSNALILMKRWAGDAYTGDAKYRQKQAVRDGNIITANGSAPIEFTKEVLLALHVAEAPVIESWYAFHKLGAFYAPWPGM